MTPQEIIIVAQLAIAFGKEVTSGWAAIYAKAKAGQEVTPEEVQAWIASCNYDALVPNSAELHKT